VSLPTQQIYKYNKPLLDAFWLFCQFTPILNLCSHIFSLMRFRWLHSITLLAQCVN